MAPAQPELKKVSLRCSSYFALRMAGSRTYRLPIGWRMLGRQELIASQYLDKRLFVQLNGSRKVIGVLRGYDVSFCSLEMECRCQMLTVLGLSEHRPG